MGTWRSITGMLFWLLVSFTPGWVGGRFRPGVWYEQLNKPAWTPPSWLFAPVWTALYSMMGVAAWLVWRRKGLVGAKAALAIFVVQLLLNGLWSWLFFGQQLPGMAALDLALLWLAIVLTILAFFPHSSTAGLLLVPYLLWTGFAAILNAWIWCRN